MTSDLVFESGDNFIPLWNPSPPVTVGAEPQAWKLHAQIGDVGYFNDQGGFSTLFNVFESVEQNVKSRQYTPPEGFVPYPYPPSSLGVGPGDRADALFVYDITVTSGFVVEERSDHQYINDHCLIYLK